MSQNDVVKDQGSEPDLLKHFIELNKIMASIEKYRAILDSDWSESVD